MKTPAALILVAALALATFAQDTPRQNRPKTLNAAPAGKPKQEVEIVAPQAPKESEVNTNLFPKMPKEPTVSYGGLASDIRKSTNRWKMFSLRRPANLKQDEGNLVRNVRTEASPAIKVFSVDF